jgi:glycosyltransferase involved in cell wall biosynthesis
LSKTRKPLNVIHGNARFTKFNKDRGDPQFYRGNPYPLICISHSQAELLKAKYNAIVYDVVHNGLDSYTHSPTTEHAGYVAWIGRFSANKGAHRAIRIAQQASVPLVMAGAIFKRDSDSQRHFDEQIRPHIDIYDPNFLARIAAMSSQEVRAEIASIQSTAGKAAPVIFSGPANNRQKQVLYGNAVATLFPISWPEPFGRVMIESMACGTPVIAYKSVGDVHCGAVAEVIDHGVTGFALSAKDEGDGINQAAKAIRSSTSLDRAVVRRVFDQKWTSERVARQLDNIYLRFMRDRDLDAGESLIERVVHPFSLGRGRCPH